MRIGRVQLLFAVCIFSWGMMACESGTPLDGQRGGQRLQPYSAAIDGGRFSPEALWSLGRIGEFAVSPDGSLVAYTVTRYDMAANRGWSDLFVVPKQGGEAYQLTDLRAQLHNLVWAGDGGAIYAISTHEGSAQIYRLGCQDGSMRRISDVAHGVDGFSLSPDGGHVLYASTVQMIPTASARYPDLDKTTGLIYDDLMYRHWDSWDEGGRSHLFVAPLRGDRLGAAVDLLDGEPYDSPLKPFGGMEETAWSPDGKWVAYTCKKLVGKEAAFSTNSDIYIYNRETQATQNISAPNPGYDRCPIFSPDGKYLAWTSMERAGFEADKERIMVRDMATGTVEYRAQKFDYSPSGLAWLTDGSGFIFVSGVRGTKQVYTLGMGEDMPQAITSGMHDYVSVAEAGSAHLVASRVSFTSPAELYRIDRTTGEATKITAVNDALLANITMPQVHERWINTTDGQQMLAWVLLPPGFDSAKSYPAIVYCQGGPQSYLTQFWSYRWNLALMASQGYVVIAPNRRGVLGFGQAWTDQISKDHGGQEMRDILAAYDQMVQEPWIDRARVAAVGASYGGYTVNWMAGHHEKRFRTFISHCGVFHSEMEFFTTEELFFDEWEMGGKPWETSNAVAQRSFGQSAHRFVQRWDTPLLVIHGGRDFRIPYTQGMAAFNAARMMGIPSRFLFFPDESHWVLKPQNGLLWQREFYRWLQETMR